MKALTMYLFALCLTCSSAIAQITTLVSGRPIESPLSGGERHTYVLTLQSGQFAHVTVEQYGIDVVITVIDPDGQTIKEVDSPTGTQGTEHVTLEARITGTYRLVIRP